MKSTAWSSDKYQSLCGDSPLGDWDPSIHPCWPCPVVGAGYSDARGSTSWSLKDSWLKPRSHSWTVDPRPFGALGRQKEESSVCAAHWLRDGLVILLGCLEETATELRSWAWEHSQDLGFSHYRRKEEAPRPDPSWDANMSIPPHLSGSWLNQSENES